MRQPRSSDAVSTTDFPILPIRTFELSRYRDIRGLPYPVLGETTVNVTNKKTADATGRARAKRGPPMMTMAFKARYSFKMVISQPREHLACGQFNSGRMIAPFR